jgi:predicted DNA-binding transcriptional regulator AlpA
MSSPLPTFSPTIETRRVLNTRDAAAFVGLSMRGWERLRAAGETPSAVQIGIRKLGYQITDLLAWIESRKQSEAA